MRAIFGILSLLVALAIVGVLVKKQLGAASAPPALPAADGTPAQAPAAAATPQHQVQQYKNAVEGALQAPRPQPDEAK